MSKYSGNGLNLAIYHHSHVFMVTEGSEHSGMRIWVTPPGKPPRPAVVLSEGVGNLERAVEEGANDTSCSGKDCSVAPNLSSQASSEKGLIQNHMELASDGMKVYDVIRSQRLQGWTRNGWEFHSPGLPVRTKASFPSSQKSCLGVLHRNTSVSPTQEWPRLQPVTNGIQRWAYLKIGRLGSVVSMRNT